MLLFIVNFLLAGVVLLGFWVLSKDICWKEALTQLGVQSVLILMVCLMIKNANTKWTVNKFTYNILYLTQ